MSEALFLPATKLSTVEVEAFEQLDEYAKSYGMPWDNPDGVSTFDIDYCLTGSGDAYRASGGEFDDLYKLDPAVSTEFDGLIEPFLTASEDWLIDDAEQRFVSFATGSMPPGTTLRQPLWHLDKFKAKKNSQERSFRSVLFSSCLPTQVAVGKLEGELAERFDRAKALPSSSFSRVVEIDYLTRLALETGAFQARVAAADRQGAGIDDGTIHTTTSNPTERNIQRSFLEIQTNRK